MASRTISSQFRELAKWQRDIGVGLSKAGSPGDYAKALGVDLPSRFKYSPKKSRGPGVKDAKNIAAREGTIMPLRMALVAQTLLYSELYEEVRGALFTRKTHPLKLVIDDSEVRFRKEGRGKFFLNIFYSKEKGIPFEKMALKYQKSKRTPYEGNKIRHDLTQITLPGNRKVSPRIVNSAYKALVYEPIRVQPKSSARPKDYKVAIRADYPGRRPPPPVKRAGNWKHPYDTMHTFPSIFFPIYVYILGDNSLRNAMAKRIGSDIRDMFGAFSAQLIDVTQDSFDKRVVDASKTLGKPR